MKTRQQILICCLLHLSILGTALAQTPVWISHYGNGGSTYNEGLYLMKDDQGHFYGSGTVCSPSLDMDGQQLTVLGQRDVLLAKWDSSGHAVWAHTAGGAVSKVAPDGADKDEGGGLTFDPQSGRLVQCGYYGPSNSYFGPYLLQATSFPAHNFVASYSADGDCLWVKAYDGYVQSTTLIDAASNIFILGYTIYDVVTFFTDPVVSLPHGGFIAKFGMDGILEEAERVVAQGTLGSSAWTSPGHWAFGGQLYPGATVYGQPITVGGMDGTAYVALTDTSGSVQWITTFPSDNASNIRNVVANGSGHVVVSGYFTNNLFLPNDTLVGELGQSTYFLASIDANGTPEWAHVVGSSQNQISIGGLSASPDGDIYACGVFTDSIFVQDVGLAATTSRDGFVLRLHPDGSVAALENFGKVRTVSSIIPIDDGILIAGRYDSTLVIGTTSVPNSVAPPYTGLADFFIAKFDSLSGVTSVAGMAPLNNGLLIYANPNNGICRVQLPEGLNKTPDMMMTIYDNTGQVVQRIPVNFTTEGVNLDVRAQAKGLYHVELSDGVQRYTGTIVFE